MGKKLLKIMKVVFFLLRHPKQTAILLYEEKNELVPNVTPFKEIDLFDLVEENIEIYPVSFLEGGSSVLDFVLLSGLAKKINKCCYLEIGGWRGESVCNVAKYAKKCVSISLSPEEARNHFSRSVSSDAIRENMYFYVKQGCDKNIEVIYENSYRFNFDTLNETFDIIFIDGDHSYEGIFGDTKKALTLLKNEKSLLVWHDYTKNGNERIRGTTYKAITDAIPKDQHGYLYHVCNTACAIFLREEVKNSHAHEPYPKIPKGYFKAKISRHNVGDTTDFQEDR